MVIVACMGCGVVAADDEVDALKHAKSLSLAFRSAARQATPSVVTIVAKSQVRVIGGGPDLRDLLRDPRFRDLFPDGFPFEIPDRRDRADEEPGEIPLPDLASQVGSGVIIDSDGYILTNNHVVESADEVAVRLPDGREFKVTEIKTDPLSDLAVLKIEDAGMMRAARLGDSDKLEIGDWVIAIGTPFELEATVSAGIISAKGRGIDKIRRGRLLQTDAAINPGNSGGPLVNLDGEVVGISTAIATSNGGYQGISFAIPINRAKWIARELQEHGRVRRAYLGIHIGELTPETAMRLGRPPRSGVFVQRVTPDGPAERAGIRADDVIVEFAGEAVLRPRDLQDAVEQKPIESKQEVKIVREGKFTTLTVTLEPLPDQLLRPAPRLPEERE